MENDRRKECRERAAEDAAKRHRQIKRRQMRDIRPTGDKFAVADHGRDEEEGKMDGRFSDDTDRQITHQRDRGGDGRHRQRGAHP